MKVLLCLFLTLFIFNVNAEEESSDVRFVYVDIFAESTETLTAWQLKLTYAKDIVTIVGIEGSEKNSQKIPYYDTRGMKAGTIILANYDTGKTGIQNGKGRIARLHLQIRAGQNIKFNILEKIAATFQGKKLKTKFTIIEGEKK